MNDTKSYRVFISYSHQDRELATRICEILQSMPKRRGISIVPLMDKDFSYGHGFHDQIRKFIAHSHVFLPLLTPRSSKRGWVHQEIGYAMGLNIPVLPVCYRKEARGTQPMPGEFLELLQAISLHGEISKIRHVCDPEVFEGLVASYDDPSHAFYRCSEFREERAIMMAEYAMDAYFVQRALGQSHTGIVRQKGGLSSFHIPDRDIRDPVWRLRYEQLSPGGNAKQRNQRDTTAGDHGLLDGYSQFHTKMQWRERTALEKHAQNSGCKLIINPYRVSQSRKFTARAFNARVLSLIEFLESMATSENPVVVAINQEMVDQNNHTMVGDWFAAESVSMAGPRQTNFTTHAPSIASRVALFDAEIDQLLKSLGWTPKNSREKAISHLRALLTKSPSRRAK